MLANIIVEGVDRLGKDTLIKGLLDKLGFFQVIHYQKPLNLDSLGNSLEAYQERSFEKMFGMLDAGDMILNRAHLGEVVYAPRYRGYSGEYVFDIEKQHPRSLDNTLLVLLTTSSWKPITDDGDSFDFSKKDEEQADFIKAFDRSLIRQKFMIDVQSGDEFLPAPFICNRVIEEFEIVYYRRKLAKALSS